MDEKKRQCMMEAITACAGSGYCLNTIHQVDLKVVEKFVKHHRLPIEPWEAVGYCDMAVFGAGKKGMLLAENFFYYSENGKPGIWIDFNGLIRVEPVYNTIVVHYAGGRQLKANAPGMAAYYANLLNRVIELLTEKPKPAEPSKPVESPKPAQPEPEFDPVASEQLSRDTRALSDVLGAALEAKMAELEQLEQAEQAAPKEPESAPVDPVQAALEAQQRKLAETQAALAAQQAELLRLQQELEAQQRAKAEAEARAKAEAEARAKAEAEARAKAEAEARAKAEAEARAKAEAEARAKAEVYDRQRQAVVDTRQAVVDARIKEIRAQCLQEAAEIARKKQDLPQEAVNKLLQRWTDEGYGTRSLLNLFTGRDEPPAETLTGMGMRDVPMYCETREGDCTRYTLNPQLEPDHLYETLLAIVADHSGYTPAELVTQPSVGFTKLEMWTLFADILPGYIPSKMAEDMCRLPGQELIEILMQIILPPHASMCRVIADVNRRVKAVTDDLMLSQLVLEAWRKARAALLEEAANAAYKRHMEDEEITALLKKWKEDGYGRYTVEDVHVPGLDAIDLMGQGLDQDLRIGIEYDNGKTEEVDLMLLPRKSWHTIVAQLFGFENESEMAYTQVGDQLPELLQALDEVLGVKLKWVPEFPADMTVKEFADLMAQMMMHPGISLSEVIVDLEARADAAGRKAKLRFRPWLKEDVAEEVPVAAAPRQKLTQWQIKELLKQWEKERSGAMSVRGINFERDWMEFMDIGFANDRAFQWKGKTVPSSALTKEILLKEVLRIIADYLHEEDLDATYELDELDAADLMCTLEAELETNDLPTLDSYVGSPRDFAELVCQMILPPEVSLADVCLDHAAFRKELRDTYQERLRNKHIPDRDEPVKGQFSMIIHADKLPDEIIQQVIEWTEKNLQTSVYETSGKIRKMLRDLIQNNRPISSCKDEELQCVLGLLCRIACVYEPLTFTDEPQTLRKKMWQSHGTLMRNKSSEVLRYRYCRPEGPTREQMKPLFCCSNAAVAVLGAPGVGKSALLEVLSAKHNTWGEAEDHRCRIELRQSVLQVADYEIEENAIALVEPHLQPGFNGTEAELAQLKAELRACQFSGFVLVMDADPEARPLGDSEEQTCLAELMEELQVPCIGIVVTKTDLTRPEKADRYFTNAKHALEPEFGGSLQIVLCSLKKEMEGGNLSNPLRYFTDGLWEETCYDHKWMWWRNV